MTCLGNEKCKEGIRCLSKGIWQGNTEKDIGLDLVYHSQKLFQINKK